MKKHNFSAGPCILPQEVLEKASEAILNFNDDDLSLIEISHRSKSFVDVMEKARSLSLELLGLENKGYKALFLQGGASLEFLMVAYNLLNKKAAYLNTGTWANNAISEAKAFGEVVEVGSSKDEGYTYIPKGYSIPEDADYFHCTSNNTISGTQMKKFPETNVSLVCDMSSDIFSRQLDFEKFDLIYAGAQIEQINKKKAALLYAEIDRNSFFNGVVAKEDRSTMNATFILTDDRFSETFNTMWKEAGISGLSGHRSVGGYRASMYNALPLHSVQALVDVMQELERAQK